MSDIPVIDVDVKALQILATDKSACIRGTPMVPIHQSSLAYVARRIAELETALATANSDRDEAIARMVKTERTLATARKDALEEAAKLIESRGEACLKRWNDVGEMAEHSKAYAFEALIHAHDIRALQSEPPAQPKEG